jgi:spermidine synthase
VVTSGEGGFQLYLNGHLQFHSKDEYRYHEALVHPALLLADRPRRVLVLGGGDALAVREVLKHSSVEEVVLVDIDPAMTRLASTLPSLVQLNQRALDDPRVRVVNEDAMLWLERPAPPFDAAIVDFPDPSTFSLGKLYTTRFFRLLQERLRPTAAVSVQCTSPLIARKSFWCIVRTLEAAGYSVRPYSTAMPSFTVWGFALARRGEFDVPTEVPVYLQDRLNYLNTAALNALFLWPADLSPMPVEINRLNNQALVRYYEDEWRRGS